MSRSRRFVKTALFHHQIVAIMYGSAELDPVVKYYDDAFALGSESERNWYLGKAMQFGGPVLDLGCGTGRLALLLARQGFHVTGIDQSSGMLDQFRQTLKTAPPEVQQRIQVQQQPMDAFSVDQTFKTIICCDAFFHNLTVEQEMGCLHCVHRHLDPEGRFVFNLPNPTCEFILGAARSGGTVFSERGRYPLPDGQGELRVEHAQDGCLLDQRITTTMRITRLDGAGAVIEQRQSSWESRYLFRYEAIHLLARCGFEVASLVGDYSGGAVTTGGQLIFEVKPGAGSAL